jgi:peroxiredoxin
MRTFLLITFISATSICIAQTYEESMDKCANAFRKSLDINKLIESESKMIAKMEERRTCVIGLKFPSFEATAVDGKTYTLDNLKGKIVLINLWFIGCAPCVAEIPIFNELQNEFRNKDFVILSFGLDDAKSINDFVKNRSVNFPAFSNSRDLITNKFKMSFGYPTNIFLDKEGRIIDFKTGGAMEESGLRQTKAEFKKLIEEGLKK